MYIEQVGDKKYKFVQTYKDKNGKIKRVSVTKNNQTRATQKQALEELNTKIDKILNPVDEGKPLKFYIEEFIKFKEKTVAKRTLEGYSKALKLLDNTLILEKINKLNLEKQLIELRSTHKASSIKLYTTNINIFFKFIRKYYDPNFNINLEFRLTKDDKIEELQKVKILNTEEIPKALSSIKSNIVRNIAIVQLHTGMRIGEVLALTPADIDFNNGTIRINKTKTQGGQIKPPKTVNSVRTIEVSEQVLYILKDFISNKKFIFNTSYTNVCKHLKKCNLKSHTFRHTHVALLIEQNIPIKVIAERLGHSDTNTTLKIYTHVTDNMKKNLKSKLENLSPLFPLN